MPFEEKNMSPVSDALRPAPHSPIYLIRHPAVVVPPGICYGQSDVALREPVEALAEQLRAQLPADFTLISSPLSRCLQLAQALGTPRTDTRLLEIDFGAWELRAYDTIERRLIDAWAADPLDFRAHGGESVRQMAERAVAALHDALSEAPAALVIVAHAGPLRALAGHLQHMPPASWMQLSLAYGSLLKLTA